MIRIAISEEAFDALTATLPLGTVAVEPSFNERGDREVWLDDSVVNRLGAMRRGYPPATSLNLRSVPIRSSNFGIRYIG
jgi:hypothetical protein